MSIKTNCQLLCCSNSTSLFEITKLYNHILNLTKFLVIASYLFQPCRKKKANQNVTFWLKLCSYSLWKKTISFRLLLTLFTPAKFFPLVPYLKMKRNASWSYLQIYINVYFLKQTKPLHCVALMSQA